MPTALIHPVARLASFVLTLFLMLVGTSVGAQQPWPVVTEYEAEYASAADIQDMQWNPDGRVLGVATADGLSLLDVNLEPIAQVQAGQLIRALSWSPDGRQVALAADSSLEIWSWDSQEATLTFERTLQADRSAYGVFWSPDGRRIATIDINEVDYIWFGSFSIWATDTWQLESVIDHKHTFEQELPIIRRLVWAPDGSPYIAGVGDTVRLQDNIWVGEKPVSIYLINVDTGEERTLTLIVNDFGTALDWQPGGNLLAVGGSNGAEIYNFDSGEFITSLGTPWESYTVQWDPGGNYVATDLSVARFEDGSLLGELAVSEQSMRAQVVDWHPDGVTLTIADFDDLVRNWDVRRFPDYLLYTPMPTPTRAASG